MGLSNNVPLPMKIKESTNNYSSVTIGTNSIPFDRGGAFSMLWLSLLGNSYLKTNDYLPPIWDSNLHVSQYDDCRYATIPIKSEADIPFEGFVFCNDGYYRGWDVKRNKSNKRRLAIPCDNGFTNGIVKWSSFTNVGGFSMPLYSHFVRFASPSKSDPPQPLVETIVRLHRIGASNNKLEHFISIVPTIADVKDLRNIAEPLHLPKVKNENFYYFVTNSEWIKDNELTNAYLKHRSNSIFSNNSIDKYKIRQKTSTLCLVFMLFFVSLPFLARLIYNILSLASIGNI
jgi:hypothetical protein